MYIVTNIVHRVEGQLVKTDISVPFHEYKSIVAFRNSLNEKEFTEASLIFTQYDDLKILFKDIFSKHIRKLDYKFKKFEAKMEEII